MEVPAIRPPSVRQEITLRNEEDSRWKTGLPAKYNMGRFLGKGGFAKCYEVQDTESKIFYAAKIVSKASITKPKAHAKLRSEIAIHTSLDHDKVVKFWEHFEDNEHVYIILELCTSQTLNDFTRRRSGKRLPEPEVMFFLYDLMLALKYLHRHRVIHRDLKLGNLFLDSEVRIKVGDFGLAAQLEHDGERKRTICGTPNYIAPEILEGKGHSFEVDIWSLGVIMYTMLIGKPPFETPDVQTTYRRIRYNQYSFPDAVRTSDSSKSLISNILRTDPRCRPTLDDISASSWFQTSSMPPSKPATITNYCTVSQHNSSAARSETPERGVNFARIDSPAARYPLQERSPSFVPSPRGANCTPDAPTPHMRAQSAAPCIQSSNGAPPPPSTAFVRTCAQSLGRPPLALAKGDEENVIPNAAVATDCVGRSPQRTTRSNPSLGRASWTRCPSPGLSARSPVGRSPSAEKVTPIRSARKSEPEKAKVRPKPEAAKARDRSARAAKGSEAVSVSTTASASTLPTNGTVGTDAGSVTPVKPAVNPTDMPEIWVTKWVDYSSKYGVGYILSDGTVGVYFNDSTKIVLNPCTGCFEYVTRRTQDSPEVHTSHTLDDYPDDLKKKVILLKHFKNYMLPDSPGKGEATVGESGLPTPPPSVCGEFADVFVKKWTRNKHAIMFQLNNKIVQVVFEDRTEAVLSSKSHMVTYVDKKGVVCSYPLSNVLDAPSPELAKRLRYTKDILVKLGHRPDGN